MKYRDLQFFTVLFMTAYSKMTDFPVAEMETPKPASNPSALNSARGPWGTVHNNKAPSDW